MDTIWTLDKNKGISQIANPLIFFGGPNGVQTRVTDVRVPSEGFSTDSHEFTLND